MGKIRNSKYLTKEIEYLKTLPIAYERNMLISKLQFELDNKEKIYFKFDYVKHHMNIDIYIIIGKDLYGHMSRLLNTMNENNIIDFDMLDVSMRTKFNIQKDLISFGVLKKIKKNNNSVYKIYMNPLFGLKNRIYPGDDLKNAFSEINMKLYNIKL